MNRAPWHRKVLIKHHATKLNRSRYAGAGERVYRATCGRRVEMWRLTDDPQEVECESCAEKMGPQWHISALERRAAKLAKQLTSIRAKIRRIRKQADA